MRGLPGPLGKASDFAGEIVALAWWPKAGRFPSRRPSLVLRHGRAAICAFLYGSALDDAIAPGRLATGMMFYGAALGASVLALFYAVTLMMLEHQVTRPAAKSAY